MIPHHLTLTNFLSYRDTAALDLRGVHLACISGLNGAGKSSILDAITWALFGKSRSGDDDVVNRIAAGNGKAAEVTFEFELEGSVYRVTRRKALGKTTELELQTLGENGLGEPLWRVLTEAKVRESEKAIRDLLRMDYDVFTNASFLLQGKADEFTTKTANRRKEILADILGVSQWDEYKARATEARKATDADIVLLDRQLADIEAELAQEEKRRRALEEAEAREQSVLTLLAAQDALVDQLRQNRLLIDQQQQALARAVKDLEEARAELDRLERSAAQRRAELENYNAIVERGAEIEAAYKAWQAADTEFARWQAKSETYNSVQKERYPLENAISNAAARLEQRQQELEAREKAAAGAIVELDGLRGQLAADKVRAEELAAELAPLAGRETAWHEARARLQQLESDRKLWAQEREQWAAQKSAADTARQERTMVAASLSAAQAGLDQAVAELATLAEKQQRLADANAEQKSLETELKRIQTVADEQKERAQQLDKEEGQDCPLCGQLLTPDHRQTVLRQLESELENLRGRFRDSRARLSELKQEAEDLNTALRRQPQLEKTRDTNRGTLGRYETRLHQIDQTLRAWDEGEGEGRYAALEALLAGDGGAVEIRIEIEAHRAAVDEAKRLGREQQILDQKISKAETRCDDLERALQQWETAGRLELVDTRRKLKQSAYAVDERKALAAVDRRLADIGYDAASHSAARARRDELSTAPDAHQKLRQAEAAMKPLTDALEELRQQSERAAARLADVREHRDQVASLLQSLQAGAGDLSGAESEQQRLREERAAAMRAASATRQKVEVLKDQRRERERLRGERHKLATRAGLLRQLEEACGRNGVQALLIETALPEIEEHANNLLYRLSGGEMRVRFDTQKEQKTTGNQVETLDIKISDRTGERPYENYSGGEKFRVNFAIRLALSQVLARRAGARLRTLVIDEGFGSQDPEGRQRLVEAINEVQPEFDCILVITHIDELRDKFPARIDVEKTPTGSRVSVVAV